jgi:RimJ/RimL family protein N-acetyltransferase
MGVDRPFQLPELLEDGDVRVRPLRADDAHALRSAAADGALWELWYTSVPTPDEHDAWLEDALQGSEVGRWLPMVVELGGRVVGTTRFYDLVPEVPRVAIGYTWYAQSFQRSRVNTTVKRLLLRHAFERWGVATVQFHTDHFNVRSQRAIEGLGARREGILRANQLRRDGSLRDTVCFGILRAEWPDVERHLTLRLQRHA